MKEPVLTIDGVNGGYISGEYTLTGTITDDIGISGVDVTITNYASGATKNEPAQIKGDRWSLLLKTTLNEGKLFDEGEIEFIVKGTDTASKSVIQKRLLFVDNIKPTVLINTPSEYGPGIEYNQSIIVKGETKDYRVQQNIVILRNQATGKDFSVEAEKTPSWSAKFNTEELNMPDGEYSLIVISTDMAGNSNEFFYHLSDTLSTVTANKEATVEDLANPIYKDTPKVVAIRKSEDKPILFTVNPDSDKPRIQINAWPLDNGVPTSKDFKGEVRIDGTVYDDDGIDTITIKLFDKDGPLREAELKISGVVKQKTIDIPLSSLDWGDFGVYSDSDSNMEKKLSKEGEYRVEVVVTDINKNDAANNSFKKERVVTRKYRIDGGLPVLNVDKDEATGKYFTNIKKGKYVSEDFKITGQASDGNGVTVIARFEKQGNTPEENIVTEYFIGQADENTESLNWTFDSKTAKKITGTNPANGGYTYVEEDITADSDGEYMVTIVASDGEKETERSLGSLIIDKVGPVVEIKIPQADTVVNGIVNLDIKSQDTSGIFIVNVKSYTLENGKEIEKGAVTGGAGKSDWTGSLNTKEIEAGLLEKPARIVAIVEDNAGNKTTAIRDFKIDQRTDVPTVKFDLDNNNNTTVSAKNNLVEESSIISGSITDDDGINSDKIEIRFLNSAGDVVANWAPIESKPNKGIKVGDWKHSLKNVVLKNGTQGLNDGVYAVQFKVEDINGVPYREDSYYTVDKKTELYFAYDRSTPVVTLNTLSPYVSNKKVLTGEASDESGINDIVIEIVKKSIENEVLIETVVESYSLSGGSVTLESGKWTSDEFDFSNKTKYSDSEYEVKVTALDIYNKRGSAKGKFRVDRTAPEIELSTIVSEVTGAATPVISGFYKFDGRVTDTVSSISNVQYKVVKDSSLVKDWADVTGTSMWILELNTAELGPEGQYSIIFRAQDGAGNITSIDDYRYDFITDQNPPLLTETSVGEHLKSVNSGYSLGGVVSDSYGLESLTINGTEIKDSITENKWNFTVAEPTTDIRTKYSIIAKDMAGRTTTIEREVVFDKTSPTVTITNNLTGFVSGSSYSFKGSASDGSGSGVNRVEYQVTEKDGTSDPNSWVIASGIKDWNSTYDLSDKLEGNKTIHVRVFDDAGNSSGIIKENFVFDQQPPTIKITQSPVSITNGTFTIKGEAADSNGLKVKLIDDKNVNIIDVFVNKDDGTKVTLDQPYATVTGGIWNYTATLPESLKDGIYTISVKTTDVAGRESGVLIKNIELDTTLPVINITSHIDGEVVNGEVVLRGSVTDNNSIKYTTFKFSGSESPGFDPGSSFDTGSSKTSWVKTFKSKDFHNSETNKTLTITVEAEDKAGNFAFEELDIIINQAGDTPIVSIENLKDGQFGGNLINGKVEDDDAVNDKSVKVAFTDITQESEPAPGSTLWKEVIVSGTGSLITWTYQILETDAAGQKRVWVKAEDIGETKSKPLKSDFTADWHYPVIKNLDVSTPINLKTESLIVSADITDDTGINSSTIEVSYSDKNNTTQKFTLSNVSGNTYVKEFKDTDNNSLTNLKNTLNDGTTVLTLTVLDNFNKKSTQTVNLIKDTEIPQFSLEEISSEVPSNPVPVISGKYKFGGTSTDTGSSVKSVQYRLVKDESNLITDWSDVTGTGKWMLDLDSTKLSEGKYTISFKTFDTAGNSTADNAYSRSFIVDQSKPLLTEDAIGELLKPINMDYSLNGIVSDTYGLKSLTISNGGDPIDIKPASGENWTYSVTVPATGPYTDTKTTYIIVATDSAGRESTVTREVLFDKNIPTVKITNDLSGFVSGSSYSFKGEASDGESVNRSGIKKVQYQVTERNLLPDVNLWTDATGTVSWNTTYDLTGKTEGNKTLHVRSIDEAGNISALGKSDYVFDQGVPKINITKNPLSITNGSFTISGEASDSNGLKDNRIDIFVNKEDGTKVTLNQPYAPVTDGIWNYTATLPESLTDGIYEISVKATDVAGRESISLTRNIELDRTKPVIDITSHTEKEVINGEVVLRGAITDSNSIKSAQIILNNGTPEDFDPDSTKTSWIKTINTRNYSTALENVNFPIKVIATDEADNESVKEYLLVINQETDIPKISIDNLKNGQFAANSVRGQVLDDDGVKVDSVKVAFTDQSVLTAPTDEALWKNVNVTGSGSLVTWSYDIQESDAKGKKRIWVKAKDIAVAQSAPLSADFTADWAYPTITNFAVSTPINSKTGALTISADITDDTGINDSSVIVTYTDKNNASKEFMLTKQSGDTYSKTFIDATENELTLLKNSLNDGTKVLTLSATDNFNKKTTSTVNLIKDTALPVINFTSPEAGSTVNGEVIIQGTASDSSGIEFVKLKNSAGSWVVAEGKENWTITINSKDYNNQINFIVKDNAGNETLEVSNILELNIDQTKDIPQLTYSESIDLTAIKKDAVDAKEIDPVNRISGNYTLSGTISDDDGVDNESIKIWIANADGSTVISDWVQISGKPSSAGKTLDWSHNINSLPEGIYQFKIKGADKVDLKGNNPGIYPAVSIETVNPIFFSVDKGAPELTVTSPVKDQFFKNIIKAEGSVKDGNGIKALYVDLDLNGSINRSTESIIVETDGSWSTNILAPKDDFYEILIETEDKYGQVSKELIPCVSDNTLPVIAFDSHKDNDVVNGVIMLAGSVTDTNKIKTLEIDLGNGYVTTFETSNKNSWKKEFNTSSYTNEVKVITVKATDMSGNEGIKTLNINIDQSADKPKIDFTTLKKDAGQNIIYQSIPEGFSILGNLKDDDGLQSIEVLKVDGPTETRLLYNDTLSLKMENFEHKISPESLNLGEGKYQLKYIVTDKNHGKPSANGEFGKLEKTFNIAIDSGAPVVSGLQFSRDNTNWDSVNNIQVANDFSIKGIITEANDIKSIDINFKGTLIETITDIAANSFNVSIPAGAESGVYSLEIIATDEFDHVAKETIEVLVDKTAPTVNITSPSNIQLLTGTDVEIRGTADDANGIERVEILFDGDTNPVVVEGTYNWKHSVLTETIKAKAIEVPDYKAIIGGIEKTIKVFKRGYTVSSYDNAGNKNGTLTKGELLIYPDGDMPIVNIQTPSIYELTTGIVKVTGTAFDDDGFVDANDSNKKLRVEVFVEALGSDGNAKLSQTYTDFVEGSWSVEINENSQFYANKTLGTGELRITVTPYDIAETPGVSEITYITLDNTIPEITNLDILQGGKSLTTEGRTRSVTGLFNIVADITDGLGLSSIRYSVDGGANSNTIEEYVKPVVGVIETNRKEVYRGLGTIYNLSQEFDTTATKELTDQIPVGEAGEITFKLMVDDTTGFQTGATKRITIDNEKPIVNYTESTYMEISKSGTDKRLIFGGTASDKVKVETIDIYLVSNNRFVNTKTGDLGGEATGVPTGDFLLSVNDYSANGTDADGDDYLETIKRSGETITWFAEHKNLPATFPTDFVVKYIARDEAGNEAKGEIAPIIIGTDMDGNGSVDSSEQLNYLPGFKVKDKIYIGVNYSDSSNKSITITPPAGMTPYDSTSTKVLNKVYDISAKTGTLSFDITVDSDVLDTTNELIKKTLVFDAISGYGSAPILTFDSRAEAVDGQGNVDGTNLSGKVRFFGSAEDDMKIKNIKVGTTVLADASTGSFKGIDGTGFTVLSESFKWGEGHKITWSYDVDVNMPVDPYNLELKSFDGGDQEGPGNLTGKGYKVVPYITGIVNTLSSAYPYNSSVVGRTALGNYPVKAGDSITIEGYSFNAEASVKIGTTTISSANVTGNKGAIKVTVPVEAKSGALSVTMNSVESTNNKDITKDKMEPNGMNNDTLTDNRYLDIWKFTEIANTQGATWPAMAVAKDNSVNFAYNKGTFFYMGEKGNHKLYEGGLSPYNFVTMTTDSGSNSYGFANNTTVDYEQYQNGATASLYSLTPQSWNITTDGCRTSVTNYRRFENVLSLGLDLDGNGAQNITNVNRTQSPSVVVVGNRNTTDGAEIYIAYYDSTLKQIKFRQGNLKGSTYSTGFGVNGSTNFGGKEGSASGSFKVAEGVGLESKVSLAVDSLGNIIVVWYDTAKDKLYFKSAKTGSGLVSATAKEIDGKGSGDNVIVKTDSSNGIHIAYQHKQPGFPTLRYIYMSSAASSANVYTIDETFAAGNNIDMTIINNKPYISYYNSTFGSTTNSLRLAFPKEDNFKLNGSNKNKYTGNWEVAAIPTTETPENFRVSIGAGADNKLVIGYATKEKGLQYAVKQ